MRLLAHKHSHNHERPPSAPISTRSRQQQHPDASFSPSFAATRKQKRKQPPGPYKSSSRVLSIAIILAVIQELTFVWLELSRNHNKVNDNRNHIPSGLEAAAWKSPSWQWQKSASQQTTLSNTSQLSWNKTNVSASPYRFRADAQLLSYPERDDANKPQKLHPNDTYITSLEDVIQYRHRHENVIPIQEKMIYFITPTHARSTQMADLTSLGQTLRLDGNVYWIVVEDALNSSRPVRSLLHRIGLPFAHVHVPTQKPSKPLQNGKKYADHRGIDQRNKGLEIIESLLFSSPNMMHDHNNNNNNNKATANPIHPKESQPPGQHLNMTNGLVYFGDDDNTYDVHLFPALRQTDKVGVIPVGFVGAGPYERCIVDSTTHRVKTIASGYKQQRRKFPVDMAGFAFSTCLLSNNHTTTTNRTSPPRFLWQSNGGTLETKFLEQIVKDVSELTPLADNCTKIYVWHTKTVSLTSSSRPRTALDTYYDGIGQPPSPPVLPQGMEHIAVRVGGITSGLPQAP